MKFQLYSLHNKDFETLIISLCEEILGIGTLNFSDGKDGGRDAKFTGTAKSFPSDKEPWKGRIIIEAKHTTKINASCSDKTFFRIIEKDIIPKIKKLKENNKIDYHLTFTNRKLTGIVDPKIEDLIINETGVTCMLVGEERIEKYLSDNPLIVKRHDFFNKLLFKPIEFFEDDIVEIIEIFASTDFSKSKIKKKLKNFYKIPIEEKNKLNNLSKDYFNNVFKMSINEFLKIRTFLIDNKNTKYKKQYNNTVLDLQELITIKRNEFNIFDEIFKEMYDFIFNKNKKLKTERNLIRIFLHYMYYNCDIGKS